MSLAAKKKWYLDYLLIIVGTGLMALAINSVFDASGLVTGGFSGIAILVKRWTGGIVDGGIPLWLTNITLNIPLFLLGCKIRGFSFVKKALNRYRNGFPWTGNHRRNRYDGSADPEISASLFHRTDYAVY